MTSDPMIILLVVVIIVLLVPRLFGSKKQREECSAAEAAEQVNEGTAVMLDVRTDKEWMGEFIAGALHIPLDQLNDRIKELQPHQERRIICYCASGIRSRQAAAILNGQGFQAASMQGGIGAWRGDIRG